MCARRSERHPRAHLHYVPGGPVWQRLRHVQDEHVPDQKAQVWPAANPRRMLTRCCGCNPTPRSTGNALPYSITLHKLERRALASAGDHGPAVHACVRACVCEPRHRQGTWLLSHGINGDESTRCDEKCIDETWETRSQTRSRSLLAMPNCVVRCAPGPCTAGSTCRCTGTIIRDRPVLARAARVACQALVHTPRTGPLLRVQRTARVG